MEKDQKSLVNRGKTPILPKNKTFFWGFTKSK
jgi:hypothetical protein